MRIAICSDEPYPGPRPGAHAGRSARPHAERVRIGAERSEKRPGPSVAEQAALSVARGECDEGIFFCWSGTGISMAANKVAGVRAALCADPGAAHAARIWNHANVLCLSNRTLSDRHGQGDPGGMVRDRLRPRSDDGVRRLPRELDARHRKSVQRASTRERLRALDSPHRVPRAHRCVPCATQCGRRTGTGSSHAPGRPCPAAPS